MQIVMTSDETQIQILAHWPMSHAKRVTRDNRKNPEYYVVAAIRKLRKDKNCPAGKSWPNMLKMSSMSNGGAGGTPYEGSARMGYLFQASANLAI